MRRKLWQQCSTCLKLSHKIVVFHSISFLGMYMSYTCIYKMLLSRYIYICLTHSHSDGRFMLILHFWGVLGHSIFRSPELASTFLAMQAPARDRFGRPQRRSDDQPEEAVKAGPEEPEDGRGNVRGNWVQWVMCRSCVDHFYPALSSLGWWTSGVLGCVPWRQVAGNLLRCFHDCVKERSS